MTSHRARTPHGVPRPTQNERILALLSDGEFHTTRDILMHVPCIVHSRIAELNKRGYRIEHDGAGGGSENHRYRLIAVPAPSGEDEQTPPNGLTATSPVALPCSSSPDGPVGVDWGAEADRPSEPFEQLRLVA